MQASDILKRIKIDSSERSGDLTKVKVAAGDLASLALTLSTEFDLPLSLLFATDDRKEQGVFGVHALFSVDSSHEWLMLSIELPAENPRYPAVTAVLMAAHWYERYLHDMFGIVPEGHPDLRRLVHHENIPEGTYPLRKDFAWNSKLDHANVPYPMGHVEGEGIYEIPVGPIHAGIIEPGHFRFNVAGEKIITLEGKLFFTHKGVEKLLEGKTPSEALPFIERLSGDMAAANALAFCQAAETLAGSKVPERALMLRTLVLELERLTMHIHDLANIGGMGTGYSFIAANGFRIKERLQRLSADIFGNRFWRGMIVPGGIAKDLTEGQLAQIKQVAREAYEDMKEVVATALSSEGFMDRLQTTGVLPLEAAKAFGALGLPARASGLDRDVRRDHPHAAYGRFPVKVVTKHAGDVHARYTARYDELDEVIRFIEAIINNLAEGPLSVPCVPENGFAIGATESWRGEVVCALYMQNGVITRCFPRDPSFCNWATFAIIGPGNIVPDFPLCNKSLNLSYSGTDM
ncbi:NADH-quinone oxidoreductase subunit F [Candidatus Falkowbacteria bacterium]|nr:NADH-quinone oxidoreductase subunit F [Candidatus Falkowbacteria bacterium]